jgi:hypothetical protein
MDDARPSLAGVPMSDNWRFYAANRQDAKIAKKRQGERRKIGWKPAF